MTTIDSVALYRSTAQRTVPDRGHIVGQPQAIVPQWLRHRIRNAGTSVRRQESRFPAALSSLNAICAGGMAGLVGTVSSESVESMPPLAIDSPAKFVPPVDVKVART